jgi:hypothetical protein
MLIEWDLDRVKEFIKTDCIQLKALECIQFLLNGIEIKDNKIGSIVSMIREISDSFSSTDFYDSDLGSEVQYELRDTLNYIKGLI